MTDTRRYWPMIHWIREMFGLAAPRTHCRCCRRPFDEVWKSHGLVPFGSGFCASCVSAILRK